MSEAIGHDGIEIRKRARSSLSRHFILSAAAILAITGAAKVWSAFGNSKLLAVADPIIGIQFGHLMLAVGMGEIVVALFCFFGKSQKLALGLVAWLATNFLLYRLGLWWVGYHKPCSCLGNLTDALHISPETADTAMKITLGYLLIGSFVSLLSVSGYAVAQVIQRKTERIPYN